MAETCHTSCSGGRLRASRECQNITAEGQGSTWVLCPHPWSGLARHLPGWCVPKQRLLDKMLYPGKASLKDLGDAWDVQLPPPCGP